MWGPTEKGLTGAVRALMAIVAAIACVVVVCAFFLGRCSKTMHIRVWTDKPPTEIAK